MTVRITNTGIRYMTQQPAAAPIFRCLPDRVQGTPVALEIRDFAVDMPTALFHENPPNPPMIDRSSYSVNNPSGLHLLHGPMLLSRAAFIFVSILLLDR